MSDEPDPCELDPQVLLYPIHPHQAAIVTPATTSGRSQARS
jgi:hypothetical protein